MYNSKKRKGIVKKMKKLNFVVGVLVVAAILLLIILLISTFFKDGVKKPPEVSSTPPLTTATATPPTTDNAVDTPVPTDNTIPVQDDIAPLTGEKITREATVGKEKLSIIFSSELFTHIEMDTGNQYFLKSAAADEAYIDIAYHQDDLELRKISFLEWYVPDFIPGSMNMLGQVFVAGSEVAAEGITTTNGTKTAEAWLIEVEGGFFSVVAGYTDEDSRDVLYRMLDTLEFSL